MGTPRVKINVYKQLSGQTDSDEIIKVAPPATLFSNTEPHLMKCNKTHKHE